MLCQECQEKLEPQDATAWHRTNDEERKQSEEQPAPEPLEIRDDREYWDPIFDAVELEDQEPQTRQASHPKQDDVSQGFEEFWEKEGWYKTILSPEEAKKIWNASAERFSELIAVCKLWPRSHTSDKETKAYIERIQTEIVKLEEGE